MNDNKINFIFQHGWGFSGSCWQRWLTYLPGFNCQFLDRGYWGEEVRPVAVDGRPSVLVCHSLGLHFLMDFSLDFIDLLVIISGFVHFHGETIADGLFSRKHIKRMLARLDRDPAGLLSDFYRDCDRPGLKFDLDTLNKGLLRRDLHLLDTSKLERQRLVNSGKILLLHGGCDRIVPLKRVEELNIFLPGSILNIVESAGHGLPFTDPHACLAAIAKIQNPEQPGKLIE